MLRLHSIHNFKLINVFILKSRFYSTTTNNSNNKLRVLFFGTDNFASAHLKSLIKERNRESSCIASIDLVCPPDRFTGRKRETITPSETKGIAEINKVDVFHTPSNVTSLEEWNIPSNKTYDLGVVVSFGYFIPSHIISSFKYGAVNVHPSLLPKYRGAAPIQHAILYGDAQTGVTVQELDEREFDAGRILAQKTVDLTKLPVYSELKERLSLIGQDLLVDTVCNITTRKKEAISQDTSQITKAPKVNKDWSQLNFADMKAWQAEQIHRAIGEQCPLHTTYRYTKHKTKEYNMQLLNVFLPTTSPLLGSKETPGTFYCDEQNKAMHILFGDGSVVACSHLKMQNKGITSANDFANGYARRGVLGVDNLDPKIEAKNMRKRAKMHRFQLSE